MQSMRIKPSGPLEGCIKASGAKNAITKLLVASLISDQPCEIHNVPNIGDVEITVNLCKEIGAEVHWDQDKKVIITHTKQIQSSYIPQRYCGANRIPILLIGALLGRTSDDIIIPTVGGDAIGVRSVDFHIQALEKLGASVEYREMKKEGAYLASAHHGLKGNEIRLTYPSVGATENAILAAVRAKGTTLIHNAAIEPEIIDLIMFLQKMGALIHLDQDRTIQIHGVNRFKPVKHRVLSDRIEIASFAMLAIATQGKIMIEGAAQKDLLSFLYQLQKINGGFEIRDEGIEFFYQGPLKGNLHVETNVHPGFMTDWQQPFGVLLTQAEGISILHETVHENRFGYTETLNAMGAKTSIFKQCLGKNPCRYAHGNFGHSLIIQGPTPLEGKEIEIPDLRAGFAYVMAALIASSESMIIGLEYLTRGYDNIIYKLQDLGADVEIIEKELVEA